MTRLLVHVEGQTEETFVNEVLASHLYGCGFRSVGARLIGSARQRSRRGGIKAWPSVRNDIVNHLVEDRECIATTMVDYYGMPAEGSKAWPGRFQAAGLEFQQKAATIEQGLAAEIAQAMGSGFEARRFVPFVMMHEYEAMLFSDCVRFGESIGRPELAPDFQEIREQFETPEEIDDSPDTAPSRRIEVLVPNYQKPLIGGLAALEIGLSTIRAECPHFRGWLERLESIPQ